MQYVCHKWHVQCRMFLNPMSITIMSLSRSGRLDDSTRARLSPACRFSSLVSAQNSLVRSDMCLSSLKQIYTLSRHDSKVFLLFKICETWMYVLFNYPQNLYFTSTCCILVRLALPFQVSGLFRSKDIN